MTLMENSMSSLLPLKKNQHLGRKHQRILKGYFTWSIAPRKCTFRKITNPKKLTKIVPFNLTTVDRGNEKNRKLDELKEKEE